MAELLPLPDTFPLELMVTQWNQGRWETRSAWLSAFERGLAEIFPQSSSRDRKLTARHYAPFYLRDGPDVP